MAGIMRILSGLPASGKSTYCHDLMEKEPHKWARVSWDDIRHETPNYKFNNQNEMRVRDRAYFAAHEAVEDGYSLLIDNTNLNAKHINYWTELANAWGLTVEIKKFDVPVEECVRRDALREGKYTEGGKHVGRVVIERMALSNGLIKFPADKKIVIVDVDGTLADCGHRRRQVPKNCQKCKGSGKIEGMRGLPCEKCLGKGHITGTDWRFFYTPDLILKDPPFPVVVEWVQNLYDYYTVLIVSGRGADIAAEGTVNWLAKHQVPYHHIFMRRGGDHRDDAMVKQDILNMLPKDQIAFTIDDRNRVVDMWRANGLTCYQVAEGDF